MTREAKNREMELCAACKQGSDVWTEAYICRPADAYPCHLFRN